MLVLSRQRDETIMIGDEIELTVVDIRGDKVRLGIKAPPEIPVHRKEIYDAIKRENEGAARLGGSELADLRSRIHGRPPGQTSAKGAVRLPDGSGRRRVV
jgi:carbon storage regulator